MSQIHIVITLKNDLSTQDQEHLRKTVAGFVMDGTFLDGLYDAIDCPTCLAALDSKTINVDVAIQKGLS